MLAARRLIDSQGENVGVLAARRLIDSQGENVGVLAARRLDLVSNAAREAGRKRSALRAA